MKIVSRLLLLTLFALLPLIAHAAPAPMAPFFIDDFETGTMANWTSTAATPSPLVADATRNVVPAAGTFSALMNTSADRMHRNIIADNGGVEVGAPSLFTAYIYDAGPAATATRVFNEVRGYSGGTGLPNGGIAASGTLDQLLAIGKYNSVTLPGEVWSSTKYQGRLRFSTNGNIYWFNLNAAGSPNRSIGWHRFDVERLADGTTINFYVDGILSRSFAGAAPQTWDTVVLGPGLGTTVGDAWIDGISVSVPDTAPPTITCPPGVTAAATGPGGAVVNYTVTATDNSGSATVNCSPASGSNFPVGNTSVGCTATDPSGNSSTCGFTVTVTAPPPPPIATTNPNLPPPEGQYVSPADWHAAYANGVVISNASHDRFQPPNPPPPTGGSNTHSFNSSVTVDINQGAGWTRISAPAACTVHVRHTGSGPSGETYDTEMLQLNMVGGGLPTGVLIRESPTKPSIGKTTIQPAGSSFLISSFFDIWTDISLDNGMTWSPATAAGKMTLTKEATTVPPIVTGSPDLPPLNDGYVSPQAYHAAYANGIIISNVSHEKFLESHPPPPIGTETTHVTQSSVRAMVSSDGGVTFTSEQLSGPMAVSIRHTRDEGGTQIYQTEMLALDLVGGPFMIRESPSRPSMGGAAITPQPDGTFSIGSYFDIFTECSTDGGMTWAPSQGATKVVLVQNAPPVIQPTPNLPPPGEYVSPEKWHAYFASGIVISNASHNRFTQPQPPPGPGAEKIHNFGSQVSLQISMDGGATFAPAQGPASVTTRVRSLQDSGPARFFETEMMALNLAGGSLPPGVMVRESPTKASTGRTSIRALPAGGFEIQSFFDVFTELSLDGGQTWAPAVSGPARMALTPPAPLCAITIQCPPDQTAFGTAAGGAVVNYPPPTVNANCPPVTVVCNPPSGSTFAAGSTTVVCTATDSQGNAATCAFKVVVQPQPPGDPCTEPDNGTGTVTLPPPGCEYLSPDQVHMIIDGLPAGTTIEFAPIHKNFICHEQQPGGGCPNGTAGVDCMNTDPDCDPTNGGTESFGSTLDLALNGTGTLAGWTRNLVMPNVFCQTAVGPRTPGAPTQSFDTEMLAIQGQLPGGDPDFDLLRITGGSNFGMPSPGHTTLVRQPDGTWEVHSFFDITYRIDFIGKPGGHIGGMSGSTTGTIRMVAVNPGPACTLAITCPPAMTVRSPDMTGAVVNYPAPTVSSTCPPTTVVCNPASGSNFPQGTSFVVCTATDSVGNSKSCEFPVTVRFVEIDDFDYTTAKIVLKYPNGQTEAVTLAGPSQAMVDINDPSGGAADTDGDGRDQVATELTLLDLRGSSSQGPVHVTLRPGAPSRGQIEENVNTQPGRLDIPPFGPGTASSYFDVVARIQVGMRTLYPAVPLHIEAQISHKPPGPGETYRSRLTATLTVANAISAPCTVPDDGSGTVSLPPVGCDYLSPSDVHEIKDGLPPGTTIILGAIHREFICGRNSGQVGGCTNDCMIDENLDADCDVSNGSVESFGSSLTLNLTGTGGLNGYSRVLTIPNVACKTRTAPRAVGNPLQSFGTRMLQAQGQITGDPDFDLLRVTGGDNFGMPSPGHTTLRRVGTSWTVDSFFDITYRIDFVGAAGGPLAGMSGSTTATIRMSTPDSASADGTPLLDENGNPTGITIVSEEHMPNPPKEIDRFDYTLAKIALRYPNGATETVTLAGPSEATVCINDATGVAADTDGDGLDQVPTEMTMINLRGMSSQGPVIVTLRPGGRSRGEIEETSNATPGVLDIPPFRPNGTARSYFDIDAQIQVGTSILHPAVPLHIEALITHKPPGPGETYRSRLAVGGTLTIANAIAAGPCEVSDNGTGTVTLPPPGCEYLSPSDVHEIKDGLPPGTTIELGAIHKDFICFKDAAGQVTCTNDCYIDANLDGDCLVSNGATENFDSTIVLDLHGTGGLAGFDRVLTIPNVSCRARTAPRTLGAVVQSFDTEMLQLQGQLPPGDPDFDLLRVTAGNGFGLPSPGHTTLTRLPNGKFNVDSFFDITYRIDYIGKAGGRLAGRSGSTTATIRMGAGQTAPDGTPLLDENGNPTGIVIVSEEHTPNPEKEIDDFSNTTAEITVQYPNGQTELVYLTGPTRVVVGIQPDGGAADTDFDGLDQVPTEMVMLNLTGNSSQGPVQVTLDPTRATLGLIEETSNNTPGTLDIPPFRPTGTAHSFFDVFFLIRVGGQTLHPATPVHMASTITHKPPAPGDAYVNPFGQPIDLLDANGNPTGIKIIREVHIPNPQTNCVAIRCPDDIRVITCEDRAIVTYSVDATNRCGGALFVTCSPPSGTAFPLGTTTVTCTATDNGANTVRCEFNVTVVKDITAPVITCPTNMFVWTCSPNGTNVSFVTTATDDHDTNIAIVCAPPSGSNFPPGTNSVTCTATDDCGNRDTCSFQVVVRRDTIPPEIECPPDITVRTCNSRETVFYTVTATDNRPGVTVNCTPPSGTPFPVGTTIVTCVASDACGNKDECKFTVTVIRHPAPVLTITRLVNSDGTPSTRVRICWPIQPCDGYRLQSTDRLVSPIQWVNVAAPVVTQNGMNCVTLDIQQFRNQFFRLWKPEPMEVLATTDDLPVTGAYHSPPGVLTRYPRANGSIIMMDQQLTIDPLIEKIPPPCPTCPPTTHEFESLADLTLVADDGSLRRVSGRASLVVVVTPHIAGTNGPDVGESIETHFRYTTYTWEKEITRLDLTVQIPGLPPVRIRESPTKQSLGKLTSREVDGGYRIGSFFDIFTELSLDGGQTWLPGEATHMSLEAAPPEQPADSENLPPRGSYQSPGSQRTTYDNGVIIRGVRYVLGPGQRPPPCLGCVPEIYSIKGSMVFEHSQDGGQTFHQVSAPADARVLVDSFMDLIDLSCYRLRMLSLDVSGGTLPQGVVMRLDRDRAGLGMLRMHSSSTGALTMDSFFDVFTELSLSGGQTWSGTPEPTYLELRSGPTP